MGSESSKPAAGPTHVWKSEAPVRFSQDLISSLESSTESDSTRAKTLELHIQARVAEELKRLQAREAQNRKEASDKLSQPPAKDSKDSNDKQRNLSRESVQNEINELRKKLESSRKLADMGKEVEEARSEVVKCLRGNDRRPLDCWKEVEGFRRAVGELEERWVEKVVR